MENENKTLTDIYLICKGWYNKKLYEDVYKKLTNTCHKEE